MPSTFPWWGCHENPRVDSGAVSAERELRRTDAKITAILEIAADANIALDASRLELLAASLTG
jgi:hypothetical protein